MVKPKKGMKAIGSYILANPTKKMSKMSAERKKRYVFGGLRKAGIRKYGVAGFKKRAMAGIKKIGWSKYTK